MKELVATVVVAIISSSAVCTLVQFFVQRHDNKKNLEKNIEQKIDDLGTTLGGQMNTLNESFEEHKATLARTHILRFADELRTGTHSREYFEQQLQDIDTYDRYCSTHPNFANGLTRMASQFIKDEYKRLYLHND